MLTFIQSDRAVMRKVLGGNAGAFRVLVERYGGVVHGVALARLKNAADAEDVAQEAFVRLYERLDQMAHRKRIGPWLVRVARNASVDLLRKRGREEALEEEGGTAVVHAPNPARDELHRLLWEHIEKLSGDAREVLILRYFLKKKNREIAALLEISTDAAEKRVKRAREELGQRLAAALGDELEEARAEAFRGEPRLAGRIMAAVAVTPVGWKASAVGAAAAATAAGVATGAGAAKLAVAVALIAAAAIVVYLAYERYEQPEPPPDVTAQSAITVEEPPAVVEAVIEMVAEPENTQKQEQSPPETPQDENGYAPVYGKLSGYVSMEDGLPAADARVWLDNEGEARYYARSAHRNDGESTLKLVRLDTRTDSAGRYEISGFPMVKTNGGTPFFMLHGEKSGQFAEVELPVTALEREIAEDLVLHPSLPIGGIVRGRDGEPVADALVSISEEAQSEVRGRSNPFGFSDVTEADGVFLFEHVRQGRYQFSVSADAYLHLASAWLPAGRTDYELQLDPGLLISGRVIDVDTGQGVPNLHISGADDTKITQRKPGAYIRGETDENGCFEISGCTPGAYRLNVFSRYGEGCPLMLLEPKEVAVGAEPVTDLEIRMTEGAVLRGTITDGDTGLPVAAGNVVGADINGNPRNCETTEGGAYEIVGLKSGDGTVTVTCKSGFKRFKRYEGPVTIDPVEMEKTHDIVLPAPALLSGTVVDDLGAPVPYASVCALGETEQYQVGIPTLADEAGRWAIDVINEAYGSRKPSAVHLQAVSDDGYSVRTGPYETGTAVSDIVLQIERTGRLGGTVVTRSGNPVECTSIVAVPQNEDAVLPSNSGFFGSPQIVRHHETMVRQVRPAGRFEYARLHPGAYTLEIYPWSGGGERPAATARVAVQSGRTTKARLVVDYGESLGGAEGFVLRDGKPAPDVRVSAGYSSALTDAHGRYTLSDLPEGFCQVTVVPPGNASVNRHQQCKVVAGQVTRLDFEIGGGGTIEGYVTRNGKPELQAQLLVSRSEPPREDHFEARTGQDGHYRLDNIPDGPYHVLASMREVSQSVEVQTISAQTTRADFDFRVGAITGTISGLREGEAAQVILFPADTYLADWTVEALDALYEKIVRQENFTANGLYAFDPVKEGEYLVAIVAYSAEMEFGPEAVFSGRIAVSEPFALAAGASVEVPLEVK